MRNGKPGLPKPRAAALCMALCLVCALLPCGAEAAVIDTTPLYGGFSLALNQFAAARANNLALDLTAGVSLDGGDDGATLFGLPGSVLSRLSVNLLELPDARQVTLALDGSDAVTWWEAQNAYWHLAGSSLLGETVGFPAGGNAALDADAGNNASSDASKLHADTAAFAPYSPAGEAWDWLLGVPGVGVYLQSPDTAFWRGTEDDLPLWGAVLRQWKRFGVSLGPYARSNPSYTGMSGIDKPGHFTEYRLTGSQFGQVVSARLLDLAGDEGFTWLVATLDALGVPGVSQAGFAAWCGEAADWAAALDGSRFAIRQYLADGDALCGYSLSASLKTDAARLPLSLTFTRKTKTSGQTVTVTKRLKINAVATGTPEKKNAKNGFTLDVKVIETYDAKKQYTERAVTGKLTLTADSADTTASLTAQYRSDWTDAGAGARQEAITGDGALTVAQGKTQIASLTWTQTAAALANPLLPDAAQAQTTVSFALQCEALGLSAPFAATVDAALALRKYGFLDETVFDDALSYDRLTPDERSALESRAGNAWRGFLETLGLGE